MTAEELRALQAPLKTAYKSDPPQAIYVAAVSGTVEPGSVGCRVESPRGEIKAGLHPKAGGDGTMACSADMLLESLVACAGVTLSAVATALEIPFLKAKLTATASLDFRGTLGVARDAPVGITRIELAFDVHSDAPAEQIRKLVELTERYCVIYQTLKAPIDIETRLYAKPQG